MTQNVRDRIITSILTSVLAVGVSILGSSWVLNSEKRFAETEKVIELDKKKADIIYVDDKCREIRDELKDEVTQLRSEMDKANDNLLIIIDLNRQIIEKQSQK